MNRMSLCDFSIPTYIDFLITAIGKKKSLCAIFFVSLHSQMKTAYDIRHAQPEETEAILALCDHSRSIMRNNGNMTQWTNGYPSREQIAEDIRLGQGYVVASDRLEGYFAFILGKDATYTHIEGGKWIDDTTPYGTIHRLASAPGSHDVAKRCFDWCARQAPCLRADTHADNSIVQHILQQHGFCYCGIIYVADGTPRRAYQKMLYPQVSPSLKSYVESEILPRYHSFDAAHNIGHAFTVMAQSMLLSQHYPELRSDMVYTIAAYHDTGLAEGRDIHHLASGRIIREDERLKEWFLPEEIETMAQAAEDHRASASREPRSLYGRIVAEADRDIEPRTIVLRTIQFGQSHYPELDKEGLWNRTLEHLHEKYDYGGYLKLYIPYSRNAEQLESLCQLIADKGQLRQLFDQLIAETN